MRIQLNFTASDPSFVPWNVASIVEKLLSGIKTITEHGSWAIRLTTSADCCFINWESIGDVNDSPSKVTQNWIRNKDLTWRQKCVGNRSQSSNGMNGNPQNDGGYTLFKAS